MASSSAHQPPHHHLLLGGSTAAPPPTPCANSNGHQQPPATSDVPAAADALSRLLLRLPPKLSLPARRKSTIAASLTAVSIADDAVPSAAVELGFFQLTGHDIPSDLAESAESDSLTLFNFNEEEKESQFPKNWPLGYDSGDEDLGETASFCLDSESIESRLSSLSEFIRALEKLGLRVVEMLGKTVGFGNPIRNDPTRYCSLMWLSEGTHGDNPPVVPGGFYPFVIGLQYQIRNRKYSLLADSGWVSVSPRVDSVLVTLGDIAQVWSNGKLQRVRGRPVASSGEDDGSKCITMSLLLTLRMDARVSPLLSEPENEEIKETKDSDDEETDGFSIADEDDERGRKVFRSFSFEDYAWRVYHERILFKDPLDRYRIRS